MARKAKREDVKQYIHDDEKRPNNPPVGLVTAQTDKMDGKNHYKFDPHVDPQLDWAGKAEGLSFGVDSVSLHVHERIDPLTIIQAVKRRKLREQGTLLGYFESGENNPPIREAIEFYKHPLGWSNRLIAGDSLLVMNSLLEKEGFRGKVQMIYIDPPYGIKYGSNFQPFVGKREVQDGKDQDLTQEPEMVKAFRDIWELGIHSYLTHLRDRLLLARELLSESGSVFMQISDVNLHHVKELMEEVFGKDNFVGIVNFQKTGGIEAELLPPTVDYLVWYCKDIAQVKYHQLFLEREVGNTSLDRYDMLLLPDGTTRRLNKHEMETGEIPHGARRYQLFPLYSDGASSEPQEFVFHGKIYTPRAGTHWKTSVEGLQKLAEADRIEEMGSVIRYRRFADDIPMIPLTDRWESTQIGTKRTYVVQTSPLVIQRCMLMTTDPGDLVFDPTGGSGTTAYVAEQWGRRWITCDTSRVAITLAKGRLMTSVFDYYELLHPSQGVAGGFRYRKIPHVTLRSIAKGKPADEESICDDPTVDHSKRRVTGPFTVEAVPSQGVRNLEEVEAANSQADQSISREGQTLRLNEWVEELLASGIRGKGGESIEFVRVELMGGTKWVHADGTTKDGKRIAISFGPEYAPLEQRQVELAIEEAQELVPKPRIVIFSAFQFDPEAAKDIDELKWPSVDILKVQMNPDLFTSDLKKKRSSSEAFWLIGQPDIELIGGGEAYQVSVNGFDYYNPKTGAIESGDASRIAMWELDTDYDGRSLYPRQVFFPMSGSEEGWDKLARTLRGTVDEALVEQFRGSKSLPFALGDNKQIAVKIIDDRGIESLRVLRVRD